MSQAFSKKIGGEIGDVRANIDVRSLNEFLGQNVPLIKTPVNVKQFKYGQSNPTYFITDETGKRFVLRKKPAGSLLSSTAHQIEREFTILSSLHKHNTNPSTQPSQIVPVPQPIILCENKSVIGTPFYVMEFLEGRIFTNVRMLQVPPTDRRECWLSAVRTLAALSSLSPTALGLNKFGPSTPYFPRQIKSLRRVSLTQSKALDVETRKPVGEIPSFQELVRWYEKHLPDESNTGLRIVHGDYKLDNLVFHPMENKVIGILDWELCTLGSPVGAFLALVRDLADLGNLTQPWSIDPKDVPSQDDRQEFALVGLRNVSDAPITLEDLEREYCKFTGQSYPISDMVFVRSWMLFRLAVISQGIAARYAGRQASSEAAHLHVKMFPVVGNLAKLVIQESEDGSGGKYISAKL